MMNDQGARIVSSGNLSEKAVAGNYLRSTRALLMAYRRYREICQEAIDKGRTTEVGDELIRLDRLVAELERRGKQFACVLKNRP